MENSRELPRKSGTIMERLFTVQLYFRMKLAISKARASGVGWVTAKRSNHFGICQWYTDLALEEGLIGMSATNTSPLVAPTRAQEQA